MSTLKVWQSHKVVEAGKITAIVPKDQCLHVEVNDGGVARITPGDGVFARMRDMAGGLGGLTSGYYVRYQDGYESWSPAQAFESGYTELEHV